MANKIIFLGLSMAVLFLFIESSIDVFILREYDYYFQDFITLKIHEIWKEITLMCLIIFFGFYSQSVITKQRKTQQRLDVSEQWFSTTLKSIGDAVITTDTNGNITFLNNPAETYTGWSLKDAFGRPIGEVFRIINEFSRESVENPVERVIKEGIVVGLANSSILIAKDGIEIPIDDSGSPIKDEKGTIIGVVLIFRDITERKKVEDAERQALMALQEKLVMLGQLAVSEQWFSTTLKSIGDAVITTDTNGNITFLNNPAETYTGWSLKDAIGRPIGDIFRIINAFSRESVENLVERVIKEGIAVGQANSRAHTRTYTRILIAKDGTEIPIDDNGSPIKDEKGNVIGVVLIFRDITERKKVEEAERQALMARQEKLVILGQLAGGVGHELRNPLGVIKNAAYFLKMALEAPEKDVEETLDVLEKEVKTSEMIINSLLGFARPKPPLLQKIDINNIVQEVLSSVKIPEIIELKKNLDVALPSILADPDQLVILFGNIFLNAIQAMAEGGRLSVETKISDPGWIAISISDTGVGIPREKLNKIFEPLFTTKAKGIGLGLSIAKIIVESHEGTINVRSELGKGSTFTVTLPIQKKAV